MIPYRMMLDYALPTGWMTPFFDALATGEALARQCTQCAEVSFPPLRACPCGGTEGEWIALSGRAEVLHRTDGADGAFALARFDGATRMATVRLSGFDADARHGQLAAPDQGAPHLCLVPAEEAVT